LAWSWAPWIARPRGFRPSRPRRSPSGWPWSREGDRGPSGTSSTALGVLEVLLEDRAEPVGFPCWRRLGREAVARVGHHRVGNLLFGIGLIERSMNSLRRRRTAPSGARSISSGIQPSKALRRCIFHPALVLPYHFVFGIDAHRDVEELGSRKGTRARRPRAHGLVGPQAVVRGGASRACATSSSWIFRWRSEPCESRGSRRRSRRALAREDHLDAHRFDRAAT